MGETENNGVSSLEINPINQTSKIAAYEVYEVANNVYESAHNVDKSAHKIYKQNNLDKLLNYQDLIKERSFLARLLNYYINELTHTNPDLIKFLNKSEKKALKDKLIYTFYLLRAQALINTTEHRHTARDKDYNTNDINNYSIQCHALIQQIEQKHYSPPLLIIPDTINQSDTYTGITKFINGKMTELNAIRLYWVWCSSMLAGFINLLPDDFFNKLQGQQEIGAPAPITGSMSWLLYYARFCVNFGLLLKHTIEGFWMDGQEKEVVLLERLKTQWQQRKFALLNDFIWASANLLCFFWLRGAGALGYAGNIVTGSLLLMDLTLTVWRIYEEKTTYHHEISLIEKTLNDLENKLKVANFNKNTALVNLIEHRIKENDQLKNTVVFERKFNKVSSFNDLAYAASLLVAFSLMCCIFIPPALIAPTIIMILALVGALLSFTLTLIYSAVANSIKIDKSEQISVQKYKESLSLLETFNDNNNDAVDKPTKECLYLQMQALINESSFYRQQANFKTVKLVQSILIDTLIPAVIFASLVLMPLGIGIGILAGGLVLMLLTNAVINMFEPKAPALPSYIESDFNNFKTLSQIKTLSQTKQLERIDTVVCVKKHSFFSASSDAKNDLNIDDDEKIALGLN